MKIESTQSPGMGMLVISDGDEHFVMSPDGSDNHKITFTCYHANKNCKTKFMSITFNLDVALAPIIKMLKEK